MTNDPLRWIKGLPWYTLGLVLLLRIGVAEANFVPTGSMQPTIGVIDVLAVDKTAFGLKLPLNDRLLYQWGVPKRGDIVTFDPSHTDDTLIKRVIGLPGDVIETRGGFLFLNGQRLGQLRGDGLIAETLDGHHYLTTRARPRDFAPVRVPAGHLFVMGDNRANSADSRYFGFLPMNRLRGRAVARLFSTEWFSHPRAALSRFGALDRWTPEEVVAPGDGESPRI